MYHAEIEFVTPYKRDKKGCERMGKNINKLWMPLLHFLY